ncbi:hypothetical protein KXX33_005608 [Aspergillus fumigatus]|nr:hypothetical protein KXX33_005608 [Aspergillus fumigatus]KAH1405598.1 hypothetical protein KXX51_008859 [Aspergillus fumigatus]KAH1438691.1 hypothetical protein KXX68_006305 [Aspergillus fumigatus]KAH1532555.1 hypothetical protein KXX61_002790 [Aspergillus fumigatus]KAH1536610.1 hypothetical protein KXX37_005904 [Aspergillus fumigatus]
MSQDQSKKMRTQRTLRLRKTIFSKVEYFCNKCNARCYLVLQTKGDGKTYVLSTMGWNPSAEQLNSYFPTPVRKFIGDTSGESSRPDVEWEENDSFVA